MTDATVSSAAEVTRALQLRARALMAVPVLVLIYLAYAWVAFDVSGVLARAQPERAVLLGTDAVAHKVHVTADLRRGGIEVAVEGERLATYDAPPDWVTIEGDTARIDLGDDHLVEIEGNVVRFTVPGYGTITARALENGDIETTLPGPAPDWVGGNARKFDARPSLGKRVQMTRTKIEVHRYFWGWENFWFPFSSPLNPMGWGERLDVIFSGERIDPDRSNFAYALDEFLGNPEWQHGVVFVALLETVLMAVLGTLTAILVALPLAFLAARNFTPSMVVLFAVRRLFDFLRGVDALIWSLIFIRAFGLGPLTGSLAIAFTDTGSLGKLFSEALENVDNRQIEGVTSTGANQVQRYRYGVIPQIMPVFLSQGLYFLESNTRSATVIGALGAGGIGLVLVETMKTARDWENTAWIVVLIIIVVMLMDTLSGWLRQRLIRGRE